MNNYFRETIINDIKNFLDSNKIVNISSGCINDRILTFREEKEYIQDCCGGFDKTVYIFITTACIFPKEIRLENYDTCDYEEWNGSIFIEVA